MSAQQTLDRARAKYRRTYDRLYVASMQADSAEKCERIDRELARANAEYDEARETFERVQALAWEAAANATFERSKA